MVISVKNFHVAKYSTNFRCFFYIYPLFVVFNCQHNIEVTNPSDTYRPIGRYWPIAQLRQRPTRFEIEIRGLTRRHRLEMRLQINPCLFARPCGLKVLLNLILQCFIVI